MAFFSYSTIDWDAQADKEVLHRLPNIIESQIRAEAGARTFKIWRDHERLRWGDAWRKRLHDAILQHDALIVLVSPSWFNSDFCQEEFDAFVRAPFQENRLLLPILWRKVSVKIMSSEKRQRWDLMRQVMQADWTELCDLSENVRASVVREYCRQVAAKFNELGIYRSKSYDAKKTSFHRNHKIGASSSSTIVSGGFAISSQAENWGMVKLVVSPLAALETEFGELVFSITGLTIFAEVNDGIIKNEASRFGGAGFNGDVAHVYRAPSEGANTYALTIVGNDGPLAGEPLTEKGEAGHVEIFEVEKDGESDPCISGQVEFNPRSVDLVVCS